MIIFVVKIYNKNKINEYVFIYVLK